MGALVKILDMNGLSYLYGKLRSNIDDFQATSKSVIDEAAARANTAADNANAVLNNVDETFLKQNDAEDTYLSKTDATSTYQTKSDTESLYLKKTDASSTYQTKSDADTNYLKKSDAKDTYLSKTDASGTYLTQTNASNTYQTKSDANNNYLKKADASSTYLSKSDASSTYQTQSDANSNYLKKVDASNTYATKQALNDAIASVTSISYSVVSALPSTGSDGVIYLVPKTATEDNNSYYEYIWIKSTSKFEKIGDTTVDLSGYLKSETAASTYLSKTNASNTYLSKNDASNTYATKTSIPTKVSQLTNDSGYKTTDNNTTYSLTQDSTDGHKLTFAGSDGTSKVLTIPDNNTTYSTATTSAAGLMSASDKTKLDGIATGANKYTLPAATSSALGGVKTGSNITNSSGTISITKANVTNALGYTPPTATAATTSADGLMSAADKAKLDGIAEGANSYTYTLPAATSSTLGGVKVGSNITVSSGTISLTKANVTAALGYTPPTTDTNTHHTSGTIVNNSNTATANTTTALANGSVYLNHIENGAVRNSHKISGSGATSVTTDTSGNIVVSSTNTTYSAATTSAAGLMSASDKSKLDGIATGANKYTLPAATSSALGGVKIGSNITNSSGTISITKANVANALGYTPPTADTHYASGTVVNNSATATGNTSSALTNGNVYLNHIENGAVKNSHKISGSGATSVTTDESGNIVVSSTNTTYSAATQSANGLMTAADKKKLDGIAASANNYSLPTATASVLGGVKVGSNITVSSGTISLTKANVTAALGYTPPTTDTNTHYASGTIVNNSNTATANTTAALANGNVYLNHIENGAVKNSHKISGSGATSVTTDTSGNIVISSTNTTYSAATQSANGLMSAADKKKLDGITISNYLTKTDASSTYLGKSATAAAATKLATARTISLSGAVSGSASFDGTGNITITTSVQAGTSAPSSLANGAIYCVYE